MHISNSLSYGWKDIIILKYSAHRVNECHVWCSFIFTVIVHKLFFFFFNFAHPSISLAVQTMQSKYLLQYEPYIVLVT